MSVNRLAGAGCCCVEASSSYNPITPCYCCGQVPVKIATFSDFVDNNDCSEPRPVLPACISTSAFGNKVFWSDLNGIQVPLYPTQVTCGDLGGVSIGEATYVGTTTVDILVDLCHAAPTDNPQPCTCTLTFDVTITFTCQYQGTGSAITQRIADLDVFFDNVSTGLCNFISDNSFIEDPNKRQEIFDGINCPIHIFTSTTTPIGTITVE